MARKQQTAGGHQKFQAGAKEFVNDPRKDVYIGIWYKIGPGTHVWIFIVFVSESLSFGSAGKHDFG